MTPPIGELARKLMTGDRRALARAVTLVESNRQADAPRAIELLRAVSSQARRGLRLGISGAPGVGKSSLIEKLGMHLVNLGHHPAVLMVDPSSQRGGGSLLGDKTRMSELARQASAFVRPSPSGEEGGGITRAMGDVLLVCEAAGYTPALVETVGVGQSESAVVSVVDLLLLLLEPGAGDELQGLKRGLLEWGDIIAVNKADGERRELAQRTRSEFATALELRRPDGPPAPEIHVISAHESLGIAALWSSIEARFAALQSSGELEARRKAQRKAEFQRRLRSELWRRFSADPTRAQDLADLEQRVIGGEVLAGDAIARLLDGRSIG